MLASTAGGSLHKGYVNIQIVGITKGSLTSFQVYPNPFSGKTFFAYTLPESGKVTLKIFDSTGRELSTILNDAYQDKGDHNIPWTTEERIPSGVYFYVLGFKDIVQSGRILVE